VIPEYKLYHGAVLAELVHKLSRPLSIDELTETGRLSAYVLDGRIGLQVKHSSQRMNPWPFTFTRQNLAELLQLRQSCEQVFLAFVCHTDGMVCLSLEETTSMIEVAGSEQAWLRIDRRRGQWYSVHGGAGLPVKKPRGLDSLTQELELAGVAGRQISSDRRNLLARREG
jgi:hypothetical protein